MISSLEAPILPAPWSVRGAALIILGRLRRGPARQLAGTARGLMAPPLLGSLAILGFIRYDETPVGPYHEMMVSPGLVWHEVPGALISHLPVDNQRSLLGGRAIWGLPKTIAHFDWPNEAAPSLSLQSSDGEELLRAAFRPRGKLPSLVIPPLPVMSQSGPRIQIFTISGTLRQVTRMQAELTIADESPYQALRSLVHGPYLALQAEAMRMRISRPFDLM